MISVKILESPSIPWRVMTVIELGLFIWWSHYSKIRNEPKVICFYMEIFIEIADNRMCLFSLSLCIKRCHMKPIGLLLKITWIKTHWLNIIRSQYMWTQTLGIHFSCSNGKSSLSFNPVTSYSLGVFKTRELKMITKMNYKCFEIVASLIYYGNLSHIQSSFSRVSYL